MTSACKSQSWIHIFDSVFRKKRLLGIPRSMQLGNIIMNLGEIGLGDMDCFYEPQDRERRRELVNAMLNLRVS
jgi:hypothetical protein